MILSKYAVYGSKRSGFIENEEASGLLSNSGLRTPSSKVSLLGDILF